MIWPGPQGPGQPVALLDREGPQRVRAEPTQRRLLTAFAADVAGILERARPVDDIMRGAAAVDPEIAAIRARMQAARHRNLSQLVSWVAARGPLRAGVSEEEATAIVWALASPEMHGLLRGVRGWSHDRYVAWLADTLSRTLVA